MKTYIRLNQFLHKTERIAFELKMQGIEPTKIRKLVRQRMDSRMRRFIEYDIYSGTILFNFFNYDLVMNKIKAKYEPKKVVMYQYKNKKRLKYFKK